MKLQPEPFIQIATGTKTIELRLNDEKRQQIQVGDSITFTNMDQSNRMIQTMVVELHPFSSFADMFAALPMEQCGISSETSVEEAVKIMRQYYPEEKEMLYGVLGIEIRLRLY
ncbi:MAG: ASCH domain-containing protein [Lachnospiraceae bacterium]